MPIYVLENSYIKENLTEVVNCCLDIAKLAINSPKAKVHSMVVEAFKDIEEGKRVIIDNVLNSNYVVVHEDEESLKVDRVLLLKLTNTDFHKSGLGMFPLYFFSAVCDYNYKATKEMIKCMYSLAKLNKCRWVMRTKMIDANTYINKYEEINHECS